MQLWNILLVKALDGLSTRAAVTAHNIANASTPGYRPLRTTFETALARAAESGPSAISAVRPSIFREASSSADGSMRLDLELATASSTALRYSALAEILNRQMQLAALAASGGR